MRDDKGHDWQVCVFDHPFMTGWKCSNCPCTCWTQDGLIPADVPKHLERCTGQPAVYSPLQAPSQGDQELQLIEAIEKESRGERAFDEEALVVLHKLNVAELLSLRKAFQQSFHCGRESVKGGD